MKDLDHGSISTYTNRKCRCDECRALASEYRKRYPAYETPEEHVASIGKYKATNRNGGNSKKQWTSAELEFITARDDEGYLRSAKTCALVLDRSVLAIERARAKCRREPRYINLLGRSPRTEEAAA